MVCEHIICPFGCITWFWPSFYLFSPHFPSVFISFFRSQFHGLRFYAPPHHLPRSVEDKVNSMMINIIASIVRIVQVSLSWITNLHTMLKLKDDGFNQLQRIKLLLVWWGVGCHNDLFFFNVRSKFKHFLRRPWDPAQQKIYWCQVRNSSGYKTMQVSCKEILCKHCAAVFFMKNNKLKPE